MQKTEKKTIVLLEKLQFQDINVRRVNDFPETLDKI